MARALFVLVQVAVWWAVVLSAQPTMGWHGAGAFSSSQAFGRLQAVLLDEGPHPIGTEANDRVRRGWEAELLALGFAQHAGPGLGIPPRGLSWHRQVGDGPRGEVLTNVVARIEGRSRDAVMVAVHHDSTGRGPGASDDGVGVAVALELAQILSADGAPSHSVIVLIDDGEEAGLLGARVFMDEHPWAADVRVVVNLEARGTTGPSLLFETSGANQGLIAVAAEWHPHPVSSSAFTTVYERMPNGTDLSVFRQHGVPGVNFAFIHGASRYHTAQDDLDHVDLATLQHHGDGALAMVRGLLAADLEVQAEEDAVFFDVAGRGLVRWPASWSVALALLPFALFSGLVVRRGRGAGWSVVAWLGSLVLAGVGGRLVAGLVTAPFPDDAWWSLMPSVLLAALAVLATWWRVQARVEERLEVTGWWCACLAMALAAGLPGVSYLFIVPAVGLVALWRARHPALACLAGALTTVVWARVLTLLPVALGAHVTVVHAVCAAIFFALLLPVWEVAAAADRRTLDEVVAV